MSGFVKPVLAALTALTLAACGTQGNDVHTLIKKVPSALAGQKGKTAPSAVSPEQLAATLNATSAAVEVFAIENRQAQVIMVELATNGPYRTYGSAARQTITLRNGMIVATRGLGGDLMSVEEDALLAKVSARQSGSAGYVMRLLTPEEVTETLRFDCTVTPLDNGQVQADCSGSGHRFSNTYQVDRNGAILAGRQWLGPHLDYVLNAPGRR